MRRQDVPKGNVLKGMAIAFMLCLRPSPVPAHPAHQEERLSMPANRQALHLDVSRTSTRQIIVSIIGETESAMTVEYTLAVDGASRTRHSARTSLAPHQSITLSTVAIPDTAPWQVSLDVRQGDGMHYHLDRKGP
jgi:hypothetical protein